MSFVVINMVHFIGRILNGCQKGLQNITSSYGHHEKNIEFITSGRRPQVINLIFSSDDHNYEWYFVILFDSHQGFTFHNSTYDLKKSWRKKYWYFMGRGCKGINFFMALVNTHINQSYKGLEIFRPCKGENLNLIWTLPIMIRLWHFRPCSMDHSISRVNHIGLGESLMAVKKDYKISQVVMVITRKILNLLRVAGGHK